MGYLLYLDFSLYFCNTTIKKNTLESDKIRNVQFDTETHFRNAIQKRNSETHIRISIETRLVRIFLSPNEENLMETAHQYAETRSQSSSRFVRGYVRRRNCDFVALLLHTLRIKGFRSSSVRLNAESSTQRRDRLWNSIICLTLLFSVQSERRHWASIFVSQLVSLDEQTGRRTAQHPPMCSIFCA